MSDISDVVFTNSTYLKVDDDNLTTISKPDGYFGKLFSRKPQGTDLGEVVVEVNKQLLKIQLHSNKVSNEDQLLKNLVLLKSKVDKHNDGFFAKYFGIGRIDSSKIDTAIEMQKKAIEMQKEAIKMKKEAEETRKLNELTHYLFNQAATLKYDENTIPFHILRSKDVVDSLVSKFESGGLAAIKNEPILDLLAVMKARIKNNMSPERAKRLRECIENPKVNELNSKEDKLFLAYSFGLLNRIFENVWENTPGKESDPKLEAMLLVCPLMVLLPQDTTPQFKQKQKEFIGQLKKLMYPAHYGL